MELVRRYRARVFRVAVSVLGQDYVPEAEDVTQDVFIRVHAALASFRGEASFGSWIYRIAFNQAVNAKARARYRIPHLTDAALATVEAPGLSPHDRLALDRRNQTVRACVEELPDVYQAALRLYYWMGTGVGEIGELLGVPEGTVKSYLHRARRLLGAMLRQRGVDDV
jgi:RNA polymerase sigma-70 factor, ECF subfamily